MPKRSAQVWFATLDIPPIIYFPDTLPTSVTWSKGAKLQEIPLPGRDYTRTESIRNTNLEVKINIRIFEDTKIAAASAPGIALHQLNHYEMDAATFLGQDTRPQRRVLTYSGWGLPFLLPLTYHVETSASLVGFHVDKKSGKPRMIDVSFKMTAIEDSDLFKNMLKLNEIVGVSGTLAQQLAE